MLRNYASFRGCFFAICTKLHKSVFACSFVHFCAKCEFGRENGLIWGVILGWKVA